MVVVRPLALIGIAPSGLHGVLWTDVCSHDDKVNLVRLSISEASA